MTIETFKSPNPRNWNSVSVMKSKFFFRLFDEHFARHFESHWLESWRHTGWRAVAHISLETPRKYGPPPPSPHHWFCLCCFLTVSCLINAILASFNILVSQLLRKIQGKTKTALRCQKKKLQKLPSFHFNRSQTSLEYGTKIFFPSKCQFSSKHWAMPSRGREMSLKHLNLPRL